MSQRRYESHIPSLIGMYPILQALPNLPAIAQGAQAGDLISNTVIHDAMLVVAAVNQNVPNLAITPDMVAAADALLFQIRHCDAQSRFPIVYGGIARLTTRIDTSIFNLRVRLENQRQDNIANLDLLQKSVAGRGDQLAITLRQPNQLPPNAVDMAHLPAVPQIGIAYHHPNTICVTLLSLQDIEVLTIFYNEGFDIGVHDSLPQRQVKVHAWLT